MAQRNTDLHVMWALDPFEPVSAPHYHASQVVRGLVRNVGAKVTPVTIQSLAVDASTNLPARWRGKFLAVYKDAIRVRLKELRVGGTQSPVVLAGKSALISDRVATLVKYAEKTKPDLVVVTTRKKLGLRELFDDSFAETFFYRSKSPVLVFGSNQRSIRSFDHILFPTDFGAKSHRLFREVLRVARELRGRLTLLHCIDLREPLVAPTQRFITESEPERLESVHAERISRRWMREAQSSGILAQARIVETREDVAHEVLALARRKDVSLIAMQDKSSPLSADIIGSNTRQVVRNSPCPVLILKTERRVSLRTGRAEAA